MILRDMKEYLKENKQASLKNIAHHFKSSPDATREMLEHWVRKGKVNHSNAKPSCGESCSNCDVLEEDIYTWND